MKFVKSMYGAFENSTLELKLVKGDVFIVTSEIEESEVYQTGVATKNFVEVTVSNMVQFDEIVNKTDELRKEFLIGITPEIIVPDVPVEEVPVPVVEDVELTVQDAEPENDDYESESETIVDGVDEVSTDTVEEEFLPELIEESIDEVVSEIDKSLPDVDNMNYKPLQIYALELEKKFDIEIDRGARKAELLAEVKAVIEKYMG